MYGSLVEVREAEQDRSDHQRRPTTDPALEEILQPAAKKQFFRHSGKEENQNPTQERGANSGNIAVRVNEA